MEEKKKESIKVWHKVNAFNFVYFSTILELIGLIASNEYILRYLFKLTKRQDWIIDHVNNILGLILGLLIFISLFLYGLLIIYGKMKTLEEKEGKL